MEGSQVSEKSGIRRFVVPVTVAIGLFVASAVTAFATSQSFSDVPPSHPFFKEIEAIKAAGITSGSTECNPAVTPAYCPDSLVRRDAMAAFMHRGFSRISNSVRPGPLFLPSIKLVETRVVSGAKGADAQQQVVVLGEIQVDTSLGTATGLDGCPCVIHYDVVIQRGGVDYFGVYSGNQVVGPAVGGAVKDKIDFSAAFTLPSGETEYTIWVEAFATSSDGTIPAEGVSVAQAQLTALIAPFGWDGGTQLNPGSD
jgi:hypothetical protein